MNTSMPCFIEENARAQNLSLKCYDLLSKDSCTTCLASAIISVPLNLISVFVIYKSQAEAVARGSLSDGPIHLIFLGRL